MAVTGAAPRLLAHDWFPAPLPAGVTLGEASWLYSSFAFRHCRSRVAHPVTVGRDCGLYNGTFFDLGPDASVEIADCCAIVGAIFCVDGAVSIGSHALIAHQVVFADRQAAVPGAACAPQGLRRGAIVLGENVWIGARSVVLGGARIGEGAIVGAASVVDFDVPAFAIVAGNPARVVGDCRDPR
jgi:acetyltransferase-like isoleucine patch superfamily enzyme